MLNKTKATYPFKNIFCKFHYDIEIDTYLSFLKINIIFTSKNFNSKYLEFGNGRCVYVLSCLLYMVKLHFLGNM